MKIENMSEREDIKTTKDINILAIETSCDETAAAVVRNGREVVSNVINSQIDIHVEYGGVVPEIASRNHIQNILPVVKEALSLADMDKTDIDAVAVTYGPGLVGALLVGVSFGKSLAWALKKPLIAVNHIEGHICANFLEHKDLKPPFAALVVSGGHTYLAIVKEYGEYELIGQTRDDAVGEAYDKVARAIGIGYPGGPKIDKLAGDGDVGAIGFPDINLEGYDFSFSGLKSAVLNYLNSERQAGREVKNADLAAAFQQAVIDQLVPKTISFCKEYDMNVLVSAGGVAANSGLRKSLSQACKDNDIEYVTPSVGFCTDNAAMIGAAGYFKYLKNEFAGLNLNAVPGLDLT